MESCRQGNPNEYVNIETQTYNELSRNYIGKAVGSNDGLSVTVPHTETVPEFYQLAGLLRETSGLLKAELNNKQTTINNSTGTKNLTENEIKNWWKSWIANTKRIQQWQRWWSCKWVVTFSSASPSISKIKTSVAPSECDLSFSNANDKDMTNETKKRKKIERQKLVYTMSTLIKFLCAVHEQQESDYFGSILEWK